MHEDFNLRTDLSISGFPNLISSLIFLLTPRGMPKFQKFDANTMYFGYLNISIPFLDPN